VQGMFGLHEAAERREWVDCVPFVPGCVYEVVRRGSVGGQGRKSHSGVDKMEIRSHTHDV
jgi:hypothetical protein